MLAIFLIAVVIALILQAILLPGKKVIAEMQERKKELEEQNSKADSSRNDAYWNNKTQIGSLKAIIKTTERTLKGLKIARIVLLAIAVIVTGISTFYTVNEQNLAVINTFGNVENVAGTGLHVKIPFIQTVEKVNATMQGMAIGYQEEDNETVTSDSLMITKDLNLVNVDFYIEYKVTNAIEYLYGSSNPEGILENIAKASIRNTIGQYMVDDVLTTGKAEIQAAVKEDIMEELQNSNTGISLSNVTIQDAEPPTAEVVSAFKKVEQAKQAADTARNEAEQYQNEKMPAAEAEVDAILQKARATKQERIDEANGEVAIFKNMYTQYAKDKEAARLRIYYESLEELLPNLKIIVNGTDAELKPVLIDENASTSKSTSNKVAEKENENEK